MNRLPLPVCLSFVALSLAGAASAGPVPNVVRIYVDDDATGANNGTSWANAYTSLATAIACCANGAEVWVAEGTYTPTDDGDRTKSFELDFTSISIYGGFQGWEASVAGRRGSVEATILSGDLDGDDGPGFTNRSDNSVHVIVCIGKARFDGLTIRGGQADLPNHESGGGLHSHIFSGDPEVVGCIFTDNYAAEWGGGAYTEAFASFVDTTFVGNRAGEVGGGLATSLFETGIPSVSRCRFLHNEVTGAGGSAGGLSFTGEGPLEECLFIGNRAPIAGALFTTNGSGLTIVGNAATQETGGAEIYGLVGLRSSIVWGNTDPSGSGEAAQVSAPIGYVNESCVQGWTGGLGGARNLSADPMFVDPIGPDGVPWTGDEDLALRAGSPCIDRGTAPYWGIAPTDLRGKPRSVDSLDCGENGVIDMGAIERQEIDGTSNYCDATPSSLGVPATLSTPCVRSLFLDDTLELQASPVPNGVAVFVMSPEPAAIPLGNGLKCVGAGLVRLAADQPAFGVAEASLDLHAPPGSNYFLAGSTWFLQAIYRDTAAGGARFNLSDAASLEIRN